MKRGSERFLGGSERERGAPPVHHKALIMVRCLLVLGLLAHAATAFVPMGVRRRRMPTRTAVKVQVTVPRISLPEAVTDAIEGLDLKNPNELSDEVGRSRFNPSRQRRGQTNSSE